MTPLEQLQKIADLATSAPWTKRARRALESAIERQSKLHGLEGRKWEPAALLVISEVKSWIKADCPPTNKAAIALQKQIIDMIDDIQQGGDQHGSHP